MDPKGEMQWTAQLEQIEQLVRRCVVSLVLVDDERAAPANDHDLLRAGLIDSLGIMEIVAFLERTFDVAVDDQDIVPDNFCSVREISHFVAEKKGIGVKSVEGLSELLDGNLPAGSIVLVVSRGDDSLLEMAGYDCWHFPRAESGEYAWFHPTDDEDAIAQLERLRVQGATHIAFPAEELWWLDHYHWLRVHLESTATPSRSGAGAVYALGRRRTDQATE